jgi:hypothetical protein
MEAVAQIREKQLHGQWWAEGARFGLFRRRRPNRVTFPLGATSVVPRLIDAPVCGPVCATASMDRSSERVAAALPQFEQRECVASARGFAVAFTRPRSPGRPVIAVTRTAGAIARTGAIRWCAFAWSSSSAAVRGRDQPVTRCLSPLGEGAAFEVGEHDGLAPAVSARECPRVVADDAAPGGPRPCRRGGAVFRCRARTALPRFPATVVRIARRSLGRRRRPPSSAR